MNRRNRKKKELNLFDDVKNRLDQLTVKTISTVKALWYELPKLHQRALLIISCIVLLLIIFPIQDMDELTSNTGTLRTEVPVNMRLLSEEKETQDRSVKVDAWREYTVQSGDTLAKVFRDNGLFMSELNALIAIEGLDKPLSRIQQGQLIRFKLTSEGNLDILQLEQPNSSVMFFRLSSGGFGRSK